GGTDAPAVDVRALPGEQTVLVPLDPDVAELDRRAGHVEARAAATADPHPLHDRRATADPQAGQRVLGLHLSQPERRRLRRVHRAPEGPLEADLDQLRLP